MQTAIFVCDSSSWSNCAYNLVKTCFSDVIKLEYKRGDKFPPSLIDWKGQWIISFKSDLVLPASVIKNASEGAVNFHPSLPKYRGIGGYVEAIRNNDEYFGATCHWMDYHIDHGPIIKISQFKVNNNDDVSALYHKAGFSCLSLLADLLVCFVNKQQFPSSDSLWGSKLYFYKDYHVDLIKIKDFNQVEEPQVL